MTETHHLRCKGLRLISFSPLSVSASFYRAETPLSLRLCFLSWKILAFPSVASQTSTGDCPVTAESVSVSVLSIFVSRLLCCDCVRWTFLCFSAFNQKRLVLPLPLASQIYCCWASAGPVIPIDSDEFYCSLFSWRFQPPAFHVLLEPPLPTAAVHCSAWRPISR